MQKDYSKGYVDLVNEVAAPTLESGAKPWVLGADNRGMGRYSFAVMEGEDVVVECGDDQKKAEQIIREHNSYSPEREAQLTALVKAIEAEASRQAIKSGLGVSEWDAFIWPEARAALTAYEDQEKTQG